MMAPERLAQLRQFANYATYRVPLADVRFPDPHPAPTALKDAEAGDDMLELCDAAASEAKRAALSARRSSELLAVNSELLAALRLCRSAINEEVIAADDLDHPVIRAHAKAAQQAARAIAKAEGR